MASWNTMKSRITATVRTTNCMNALLTESILNKRKALLNAKNNDEMTITENDDEHAEKITKNNLHYFHTNFNMERVYKLIEAAIEEYMILDRSCHSYDSRRALQLTEYLSSDIRDRIKRFNYKRYRIVCVVTIIEKQNQGIMMAMRHLMDKHMDNYTSFVYERPSYFIITVVYLVYKD